jgi:hypothetical protein
MYFINCLFVSTETRTKKRTRLRSAEPHTWAKNVTKNNPVNQKTKQRVLLMAHFYQHPLIHSVFQMPSTKTSQMYYLRKIYVYNICIYDYQTLNYGYYLAWSELMVNKTVQKYEVV